MGNFNKELYEICRELGIPHPIDEKRGLNEVKQENLKKIEGLKKYANKQDDYEKEIRCKCTMKSYDGGKSWVIDNVFYVSATHQGKIGKFIEEVDLQGLTLTIE